MKLPKNAGRLQLKVFSPYQTFYEGEAVAVTGINESGPFDVLFNHADFFSLLTAGEVKVATGFQEFKFPINHGIIKVTDNRVSLFVDV